MDLKEAQSDLSVRFTATHHLDTVDRLERVLVVQQRPVSHVDQSLNGAHPQQTVDVVRRLVDGQRNELRLRLVGRLTVQHQNANRVAVVVVDGAVLEVELVPRSYVVVAVTGAVMNAHRLRVRHSVDILYRRHLPVSSHITKKCRDRLFQKRLKFVESLGFF